MVNQDFNQGIAGMVDVQKKVERKEVLKKSPRLHLKAKWTTEGFT